MPVCCELALDTHVLKARCH